MAAIESGVRSLALPIPGASPVVGRVERADRPGSGGITVSGSISGTSLGRFVLAVRGPALAGVIRLPETGQVFEIGADPDGAPVISEVDAASAKPCGVNEWRGPMALPPPDAMARGASAQGAACGDGGGTLVVLAAYTSAARLAAGGTSAMLAFIDLAVAATNDAYANSLVVPRLHLVYATEVSYNEFAGSEPLYDLSGRNDGRMDELHALRDLYRADLVSLFIEDRPNYCGIAGLMGPDTYSHEFEQYAFNVTVRSCPEADLVFAHEIGHNLGCQHNRGAPTGPPVFPYSYGFLDPQRGFRTIMAYPCPGQTCPWIPHFSNPDVLDPLFGRPTGIPPGSPGEAHNALTINQTAPLVACFREGDCNGNGIDDAQDVLSGASLDCNGNLFPDECEPDCNANSVADACDVSGGTSLDCTENHVPDECEPDCDGNGSADSCDIAGGLQTDCNGNLLPDLCEVASGAEDCDGNGTPDDCQHDCNGNGVADICEIAAGLLVDGDGNDVADACEAVTLLVKADAQGLNQGTSWNDAFADLEAALAIAAVPGNVVREIWVAQGTYVPSRRTEDDPRTATFSMKEGLAILGGFAGFETASAQRNPELHPTILSGDVDGDDGPDGANRDDNVYHVVYAYTVGESAVIDGFTIKAGDAAGTPSTWHRGGGGLFSMYSDPTVRNCVFADNAGVLFGGGVYVFGRAATAARFERCAFLNNTAEHGGSALVLDNMGIAATLVDCTFAGNRTGQTGCGTVFLDDARARIDRSRFYDNLAACGAGVWAAGDFTSVGELISCDFRGNSAAMEGVVLSSFNSQITILNSTLVGNTVERGTAFAYEGGLTISNSIFWGNAATAPGLTAEQVQIDRSDPSSPMQVDHSCVQGLSSFTGNGNTGADPRLENPPVDVRLQRTSPCIDSGRNDSRLSLFDVDGWPRRSDVPDVPDTGVGPPPIVDMGAYEFPGDCDGDGIPDTDELLAGAPDCNGNRVLDPCDTPDCNANLVPDDCDIASGSVNDCDGSNVPDECEQDCNRNGRHDSCDIAAGTSPDIDSDGVPDECLPVPSVSAYGPRRLSVTPAPAPEPIALRVTSQDHPCLSLYVGSTGLLGSTPVYRTSAEWSGILVYGPQITPNSRYAVRSVGTAVESPPREARTERWGDVLGRFVNGAWTAPDGTVTILDAVGALGTFSRRPEAPPVGMCDLEPATPDGRINLTDVVCILDGFANRPYSLSRPCP